ncbi:DUF5687 family protein [Flavobacterium sp.]|uniref:DUF5687 family protein n=1 Tax=Flavobacterium sp. TaxID=239 RepID=UPI003527D77F
MIAQFLALQWKSFFRSKSFGTNLFLKIVMIFGAIYFAFVFAGLGFGVYFILKKMNLEPLPTVSGYIAFYFIADLTIRFFLQSMPTLQIRPLLTQNIKKNSIVNFTLGKTILSFFNFVHWFFFIPFIIVLMVKEPNPLNSLFWGISMLLFVYCNNFIAILIDKKDAIFYAVVSVFAILGVLQYFNIFNSVSYLSLVFQVFVKDWFYVLIPLLLLIILYVITFKFFKRNLYLDAGLAGKHEEAKTENLSWLDKWGTLGEFIKNDIRLIKRNKRARTTVLMSVLFIFYGLLFFTNSIDAYSAPVWKIFAGIFVSGGFLLNFGQFVPSWDSSYYPLMMTQNITYKDYLTSKWWLMVIGTVVTTILASFYLYFGWEVYLAIVTGAIFNIGVNSTLVMLGGAYIKTPIDLTSNKNAFGDKKSFNVKTLLISLPKLLLPMLLYAIGYYTISWQFGYLLVALAGVFGFLFRNKIFKHIEKVYQTQKYDTLEAYKQK